MMMTNTRSDRILALLADQKSGWSLARPFYLDADLFDVEREKWFSAQWMVVGHRSEVPRKGSHIVRQLFDCSIIIVNAGDAGLRAYHNVCTHRGSQICKQDGQAPLLVCPYHAWSFRLSGELQTTRELPEGVDPSELGLRPVPLKEVGGLILCGLDEARLPDVAPVEEALLPALRLHGIDRARIAVRRHYPTLANWKLVLENFFECYHCRPSHPEYFSMNGHVKVTAMRDEQGAQDWQATVADWNQSLKDGVRLAQVRDPGSITTLKHSVYRQPIGLDRRTHSKSGQPVAPLMGLFDDYDGGETGMHVGRLSFVGGYNDHAVIFQFNPVSVQETDVIVTWLVDQDADLSTIDIDALTFLWDVTTVQDKKIIEANAAGVRSPAYRPGPYTVLEEQTANFVADYMAVMRGLLTEEPVMQG
ncbi:aromatic ring-hydroxylating dioxygenase subunit alpha [Sphingobium sp. HBC34]|uniref:Aromatic ring-hydroxylating dioxygenase subunit alpha n=1 Tax=Sphingobium cyanobacteriorum TaxID=3063954 RepID=A0ABT8ZNL4_9SPHN|nr:aromatic ring-hydroxylating dioxygenase subunit alpha [Sphingobium sp. HBC34]MDO7835584.1 aromatic ring-hydroxylating dioxygenase subunit alpha [Sphingobium sp. HBC34]